MIANNIIALSRQACNCQEPNPEWDIKPIFDVALADDIDISRFVTDSCRTVWSAMNDVRSISISKFCSDFESGLRNYVVRRYGNESSRVGFLKSNWIDGYVGCVLRPNRAQFHEIAVKTIAIQANKPCDFVLSVFDNLQNKIASHSLRITQGYSTQKFDINVKLPCFDTDNADLTYFFAIMLPLDVKICDTNTFCCGRSHNFHTHQFIGNEANVLNYAAFGGLGDLLNIASVRNGTGGLCLEVQCIAKPFELLQNDDVSYRLAAECIQLAAVSKAYERVINSPEISRATMIDRETAVQSTAIFANRYTAKLNQLLEQLPIPQKSAWVKRNFGNMKINSR